MIHFDLRKFFKMGFLKPPTTIICLFPSNLVVSQTIPNHQVDPDRLAGSHRQQVSVARFRRSWNDNENEKETGVS